MAGLDPAIDVFAPKEDVDARMRGHDSKATWMTPTRLVPAVLWMIGALLSFSTMAVAIRELSRVLGILEILALRSGSGLVVLTVLALARPELRRAIRTQHIRLHLLRNGVHFAAQVAWATSLTLLPLATVFSLEFTMPAWTAIMAAMVLHERLTPSRIGSVILGFAGVLVIIRPGLQTFQPAALLTLAAAFGYAIALIATKRLTATDQAFTIVFWMMAMQLPMNLVGSHLASFANLGTAQMVPIIGLGVAGLASHYCLSNAFRAGEATLVVPIDFLRIPLIALVGWWLYAEPLDVFVFAGAALIVSGILWNLRAETRKAAPLRTGTA